MGNTAEDRLQELENENKELKGLLEYYYGAEQLLEKAESLLDDVMEAEEDLSKKAEEIDNIAFDNDHEFKKRELRIEEKEKEAKRLLEKAQKKNKEAQAFIDAKAQVRIREYRNLGIRILVGITVLYSVIALMIYLRA